MDICRADEAALAQLKSMATRPPSAASSEDVDVQLLKTRRQTQHYRQQSQCTYCGGRRHARQKCPAAGVQCHKCGRRNHFARVCHSGTQSSRQKVHEIHDEQGDSSEEELLVAAIEDGPPRKDWSATVTINAHHVTFKIDTGAQCNVMSYATFSRISQQPLRKSRSRLVAFGGHRLNSLGKATLLCEYKHKFWAVDFEVLDNASNVLGLKTSAEMKLVQRIETLESDMLAKYADTFTGLGCITGVTHHSSIQTTSLWFTHPVKSQSPYDRR